MTRKPRFQLPFHMLDLFPESITKKETTNFTKTQISTSIPHARFIPREYYKERDNTNLLSRIARAQQMCSTLNAQQK
jgi:hypothetical protein